MLVPWINMGRRKPSTRKQSPVYDRSWSLAGASVLEIDTTLQPVRL